MGQSSDRTEDSQLGEPPASNVLTAALRTWWGKALAVVTSVGILLGAAASAITIWDALSTELADDSPDLVAEDLDEPLGLAETPSPGQAQPILGFGDSAGGRLAIPYKAEKTAGSDIPVLNSMVDVPNEPDERMFLAVRKRVARGDGLPRPRSVRVDVGSRIWIRGFVSNDASPHGDCSIIDDSARVAQNTRLRVATSIGEDGRHVIRAWVSADNAEPEWITDAVLVVAPPGSTLRHLSELDESFDAQGVDPLDAGVTEAGGIAVGEDGRLGSCWENRWYFKVHFEVV